MTYKLVVISLLVFLPFLVFSQTAWSDANFEFTLGQTDFKAKTVVPPSPEAAELGKYGNTPVSLFTGTPKINVPIYELKGTSLSLPISLSYNANGFKPQDIATWVGLGWSLNAGGVISRSVMGNPDMTYNYYSSSYNYLSIPPVTDLFRTYDYYYNQEKAWMESQPDMYFYNFGNYSGKFLIHQDYSIVRKQKDNLNIVACPSCGVFLTATDENGTLYQFNDIETSTEQLSDQVDPNIVPAYMSYVFPSSWFLTNMYSADGSEQMQFTYYTTDSLNTMFNNYLQNQSASYSKTTLNCIGSCSWVGGALNYSNAPTTQLYRKYLKRITLIKSGQTVAYIDFNSVLDARQDLDHSNFPEERVLANIQVHDNSGNLIKQVNFNYSYFTGSGTPASDFKRLRLDSLQEIPVGTGTASKPPYKFTYNSPTSMCSPNAGVDHWGFFNGSYAAVTYNIPTLDAGDGTMLGMGANRNPSTTGSSLALLNQITYPTGGYTSFIYEGHDAGNISPGINSVIGGVRIKQIIDYSFAGKQAVVKNYQYLLDNGSTSSGISTFPIYSKTSSFHHFAEPKGWGSSIPDYTTSFFTISSNSVYGLGSFAGSHIGYSQVTEFQSDPGTGGALGRTVYKYHIGTIDNVNDDESNGDLIQETTYDINNKVLIDETNTYNYPGYNSALGYKIYPLANQDNLTVLCKYNNSGTYVYEWITPWDPTVCDSSRNYSTKLNMLGYFITGIYKQKTLNVKKVYDQASNTYSIVTSKYTYGNLAHNLPTVIEQYSSSTDEVVTTKKYAADYIVPTGTLDNPTKGIQLLQTKNIVGAEIENVQYRQNLDGSNKRYISGLLNFYSPTQPYPTNLYRLELSSAPSSLIASTTNGTFSYDPSYKALGSFLYDVNGNLIEQSKTQDVVKAYIWDYYNTMPTAEVVYANASGIAYSGFEPMSTGGNWTITGGTQTTGGMAGAYSYTLASGNTITKSGLSASRLYIVSYWSHSGTATVTTNIGTAVGITGLTINGWTYHEHALAASSTSVTITGSATNIDELRLFPKDAQMVSYTYKPLVGISSQSSPSNVFTNYEYDGLNRLLNIKDQAGNIIKNYKYNYGLGAALTSSPASIFYSAPKQGTATKTGCPAGTTPTSVTYYVLFGKYVSSISQADADAKAQTDVNNNQQTYANTNGQCLYYSVQKSGFFFKSDCLPSQGLGSRVNYIVAAGAYSSTISQADADAKAQADVTANGQAYANSHGTCSCATEGHKYINGVCTTGTRYNTSTTHMADGTWQCTYYYAFSDGTVSQIYTVYGASPCSIQ